jgi:hypothetical protein
MNLRPIWPLPAALLIVSQNAFALRLKYAPEFGVNDVTAQPDPAARVMEESTGASDIGGLDLAQALLLPGYWQARHGQWLKAGLFASVEVGVILLANKWNKDGDDLDAAFRAYADTHWDYDRYVDWRTAPGEFALEEGWLNRGFNAQDLAGLSEEAIQDLYANTADDVFDPHGGAGSHILPGGFTDGYSEGQDGAWDHFGLARTQQFYEMIGKYAQFQRGWDDYGVDQNTGFEFPTAQGVWSTTYFSPNSRTYISMRTDSNDKLIAADRIMGLLLVNHVVSFMDVMIQRRMQEVELGVRAIPAGDGSVSALSVAWSF